MVQDARQAGVGALGHARRIERAGPLVRIVIDVEVFGLNGLEVEAAVLHLVLTEILRPAARRCGAKRDREEHHPTAARAGKSPAARDEKRARRSRSSRAGSSVPVSTPPHDAAPSRWARVSRAGAPPSRAHAHPTFPTR